MALRLFSLDSLNEGHGYTKAWPAAAFGRPWNGWATPIVSREVLVEFFSHIRQRHAWASDGHCVTVFHEDDSDLDVVLEPLEGGFYDLGMLGWTFDEVEPDELEDAVCP